MVSSTEIPKAILKTNMVEGFMGTPIQPISPAVIINGNKLGISKKTMNSIFRNLGSKNILEKKDVNNYLKKKSFINNYLYKKIISELPAPPYKESLAYKFPELTKEFNVEKNKPFKASYFRPGSHSKVYWVCSNNKIHKWKQSITNRAIKGSRCPKCRSFNYHKNIDFKKTLKFRSPELSKEFDISLNRDFLDLIEKKFGHGKYQIQYQIKHKIAFNQWLKELY